MEQDRVRVLLQSRSLPQKVRAFPRIRWEPIVSISSPLLLIAVWETMARLGVYDVRFIPPPSHITEAFSRSVTSGQLASDVGLSLMRMAVGIGAGATIGIIVGAMAGLSPTFRAIISPLLVSIYSIPKIALLPLLILLFGFGELSKVLLIAMTGFFLTQVNTVQGVLMIDKVLLDVARNCKVSRVFLVRTVAIPGALPYILAGLKLAWTVGFIVMLVAEMTATDGGLGYFVMSSWRAFRLDDMMVGLIALGGLGYVSTILLDNASHRMTPWVARGRP